MKRAVSYLRCASDDQSEISIEHQRRAIMKYCVTQNLEFCAEYVDRTCSATTDRRESFQRLIRDARDDPEWDTVLVFDLSRFTRNALDAVRYTALLEDCGIQLISVAQNDANEGELLRLMLKKVAQY